MIFTDLNGCINVDNDGFMEITDYSTIISNINKEEFQIARKLNQYMYSVYAFLEVNSNDVIKKFIVTTFNKIHKTFQSVLILCSKGLNEQAKVLIRTMLDKMMIMQAVINDANNYNDWIRSQGFQRNKLIKDIDKKVKGLQHLKLPDGAVVDNNARQITQKEWAEKAGMLEDYNYIYRLFSGNVHVSSLSIDADNGTEDNVKYINIAPRTEEIGIIVLTVIEYAVKTTRSLIELFNLDPSELNELDRELEIRQKKCFKKSEDY